MSKSWKKAKNPESYGSKKLAKYPGSVQNVDNEGNIYNIRTIPYKIIGKVK